MGQPDFTIWDRYPDLRLIKFIDIESSGLILGSYPIQFGWCGFDLRPMEVLVRPLPHWTPQFFDPGSVQVHGIRRSTLLIEGVEATEVADRLNTELKGCTAYCDALAWDRTWTDRLYDDIDARQGFALTKVDEVFERVAGICDPWCVAHADALSLRVNEEFPHIHKAGGDSLRLAALARMLIDRDWSEWLLSGPDVEAQT
jgi:hypothetical protein